MTHHDTDEKTVFGFWVFLMSDFILFATLFATYAVLCNNTFGGSSAAELFNLPFTLTQTLILLTASFASAPALIAGHRHEKNKVVLWLSLIFVLGVSFMAIEGAEFMRLIHQGNTWEKSAFLSAFFNLVGTHGAHVMIGLLWIAVLLVQVLQRGLTPVFLKRLTCLRLFWHFLNIIWIFIFTFVYLIGVAAHV